MGAGPEQHGIASNEWQRKDVKQMAYCGGEKGETWPTIFKLVRQQIPQADIACFLDWGDFGRLVEPNVLSIQADTRGEDHTTTSAINYIKEHKPLFIFIHLDHVDHVGHEIGHSTPAYYKAVSKADSLVGAILAGIEDADIQHETTVLVTSDHGGKGKGHGGKSKKEVNIPWIIAGPGIALAKAITDSIITYDTAATIAYLLGITTPSCWIAKPVSAAFEKGANPISAGASFK